MNSLGLGGEDMELLYTAVDKTPLRAICVEDVPMKRKDKAFIVGKNSLFCTFLISPHTIDSTFFLNCQVPRVGRSSTAATPGLPPCRTGARRSFSAARAPV